MNGILTCERVAAPAIMALPLPVKAAPAAQGIPLYGKKTPGSGLPGTSSTLIIDEFLAWLDMQGFLKPKAKP